jgi:hypothetical protein
MNLICSVTNKEPINGFDHRNLFDKKYEAYKELLVEQKNKSALPLRFFKDNFSVMSTISSAVFFTNSGCTDIFEDAIQIESHILSIYKPGDLIFQYSGSLSFFRRLTKLCTIHELVIDDVSKEDTPNWKVFSNNSRRAEDVIDVIETLSEDNKIFIIGINDLKNDIEQVCESYCKLEFTQNFAPYIAKHSILPFIVGFITWEF